ncbi:tyrosine-type recombinase/integrase [Paucibacter sp. DJ4R-1]|nr:tyrosine-type recombinase/integrase [Paucibacter sp. DJ4R-1]
MGRKPSRWNNLPKGMRARPRGNLVHYYLDTGAKPRKEIPLGSDYVLAVKKWAELTHKATPQAAEGTFAFVAEHYWRDVIPTKAPRTRQDNEDERAWLMRFFNDPPAPLDCIEPTHIRKYMDWRVRETRKAAEARNAERVKAGKPPAAISPQLGHVRANREKALFSHIWNYARNQGFTKLPNPCLGIKGFKEAGRDVYVSDTMLAQVMTAADKPTQFALRLAQITGQRPADVLSMSETDLAGGMLHIRQGKTRAKLRIVIEGELKALLDEIAAYKTEVSQAHPSRVRSLALLINERGQKLSRDTFRSRFDTAREKAGADKALFQFRDLRAKTATDTDDAGGTRAAQAILGHTTETMTADYIRHKVGKKVRPIR